MAWVDELRYNICLLNQAVISIIVKSLLLILFILCLSGCAGYITSTSDAALVTRIDDKVDLNNSVWVKQQLLKQYIEWAGTPYKVGGLNRHGVDCSGFVYLTFRSKLGFEIPRSTELQQKIGVKISRSKLRTGDLILFKTGFFTRHIGIYLGKGQFIHASSSQGISISNLNNSYWQSKYWKSRRLNV